MAALAGEQSAAYAAVSRSLAEEGLEALDRRLAASPYLAGERFTVADITAFSGLDFGRLIRYEPPPGLANVARWSADLRGRPAASAGL